ncbi:hypothetical protein CAEBREN_10230 [Caenorhabditis brenneri]|uniref:Uncharacterized protein n=1 Tax=Caenorhabditis brenneri TaxID=135651 RepID=G0NS22_CAEBE|nr:hypothetical protein CAEBREN_10230 [Caenorhabditis brenneri]
MSLPLPSHNLLHFSVLHACTVSSPTTITGKKTMSGPCKVCEKPGHGIHYGVWTCESCKSFFVRSSRKGTKTLVCNSGSDCVLSGKESRTICGYCRFQKCVKLGMAKKETLRYHSYGKAQCMVSQSNSMEIGVVSITETLDTSKLTELQEINNIVDSYKEGCCFTTDKVKNFELKKFSMVTSESAEIARVKTWMDYAKEYEADIKSLLPFVDDLQDSFNSHDKAILLKRSAFQIYLLRRVRAFNPFGLLLSDGRVINMIDLQLLYGMSLAEEMQQFVKIILQMGCTDEDIAMFIPIVFYKSTKLEDLAQSELQNPQNLSSAQQKFKTLFVKHAESQSFDQRVFQGLINLLPEMEKLEVTHQEALAFLKPYRWAFPEDSLFAEVYDLDSKIVTIQKKSDAPSSSSVSNGSC